jgi:hypothetical protein
LTLVDIATISLSNIPLPDIVGDEDQLLQGLEMSFLADNYGRKKYIYIN